MCSMNVAEGGIPHNPGFFLKWIQNKAELIMEIDAENFTFEITIPSTNLDARDVACVVASFGQVCCEQHKKCKSKTADNQLLVFKWRKHIPNFKIAFPSEVLVSSDYRPYKNLAFYNVLARQGSLFHNRAHLNFQAFASHD